MTQVANSSSHFHSTKVYFILLHFFLTLSIFSLKLGVSSKPSDLSILPTPVHETNLITFHQDVVFVGNLSTCPDVSSVTQQYQLAFVPLLKNVNLSSTGMDQDDPHIFQHYSGLEGSHPLIFLVLPETLEDFHIYMDKLTALSSVKGMNRESFIFFFLPSSSVLSQNNYYSNNSIVESIRNVHQNPNSTTHHFRQDSQIYLVQDNCNPFASQSEGKMFEVYTIKGTTPLFIPLNGEDHEDPNWIWDTGRLKSFGWRRRNFQNVTIKIVSQSDPMYSGPLFHGEVAENYVAEYLGGPTLKLLQDFQEILNFSYTIVAGKGWTSLDENDKLQGIGRQILENEADFSITTNWFQVYRAKELHFLQPVITDEVVIFFRQPSLNIRNIFSLAFQRMVWFAILVTWILIILSMFILIKLTPKRDSENEEKTKEQDFSSSYENNSKTGNNPAENCESELMREGTTFSFSDIVLWAIGTLSQQGWAAIPENPSQRMIFLGAMLSSAIIYSCYTAAFVAAISAPTKLIRQVDDLEKYQFQLFIDSSLSEYSSYFVSDEEENMKLMEASKSLFKSELDAIDKVMKESSKLALIIPVDQFYTTGKTLHQESDLCRMDKLRGTHGARTKSAMFVNNQSDIKEFLAIVTIFVMERGLNRRYWIEYNEPIRCDPDIIQVDPEKLTLGQCYFAFVFLGVGFLLGPLLSVLEK